MFKTFAKSLARTLGSCRVKKEDNGGAPKHVREFVPNNGTICMRAIKHKMIVILC